MSPVQFELFVDAYKRRKKTEAQEVDALNYLLGKYIAFAHNDPKKYPRKPFLAERESGDMDAESMSRIAKEITLSMGGKIKDGKRG